jgi:hypothetical protein
MVSVWMLVWNPKYQAKQKLEFCDLSAKSCSDIFLPIRSQSNYRLSLFFLRTFQRRCHKCSILSLWGKVSFVTTSRMFVDGARNDLIMQRLHPDLSSMPCYHFLDYILFSARYRFINIDENTPPPLPVYGDLFYL